MFSGIVVTEEVASEAASNWIKSKSSLSEAELIQELSRVHSVTKDHARTILNRAKVISQKGKIGYCGTKEWTVPSLSTNDIYSGISFNS